MARQKKKKPVKRISLKQRYAEWREGLGEIKIKFILGLLIIVFSFYLFIAYLSFFFTGYADKSTFDISWWELVSSADITVHNWTGKFGAWMADLLINQWFGVASVLIIFYLFVLGARLTGSHLLPLRKTFYHSAFIMIWVSVTLGFATMSSVNDHYIALGGAHGYFISKWLVSSIGYIGTMLLLLISLITYLAFTFESFYS